jgi:hypothetical protein
MKVENKYFKKNLIRIRRFCRFGTVELPDEKKYYESIRKAIIHFLITIILITVFFTFSNHKDFVVRIGIFALFFNFYQFYKVFTIPLLVLNKKGMELRPINIPWKNIKKVRTNWKNHCFNLQIQLMNGKIVKEKLTEFSIYDYMIISTIIKAFQKKYRNQFIFKK